MMVASVREGGKMDVLDGVGTCRCMSGARSLACLRRVKQNSVMASRDMLSSWTRSSKRSRRFVNILHHQHHTFDDGMTCMRESECECECAGLSVKAAAQRRVACYSG